MRNLNKSNSNPGTLEYKTVTLAKIHATEKPNFVNVVV